MGDPRDGLAKQTAGMVSDLKADLRELNQDRRQVNDAIFDKFKRVETKIDEAASIARTAAVAVVEVARATKETTEAAHVEVIGIKAQIDTKFKELNGSVATAVGRLKKLEDKDGDRDAVALQKAVTSNAVKVATEGVLMIPKPTWRQLSVLGAAIAFIGFDRIVAVIKTLVHLIDHLRGVQ